jgi:hypothetical protein
VLQCLLWGFGHPSRRSEPGRLLLHYIDHCQDCRTLSAGGIGTNACASCRVLGACRIADEGGTGPPVDNSVAYKPALQRWTHVTAAYVQYIAWIYVTTSFHPFCVHPVRTGPTTDPSFIRISIHELTLIFLCAERENKTARPAKYFYYGN